MVWDKISYDSITSGFKNDCCQNLIGRKESVFWKIVKKSSDDKVNDSQDAHDAFESDCFLNGNSRKKQYFQIIMSLFHFLFSFM